MSEQGQGVRVLEKTKRKILPFIASGTGLVVATVAATVAVMAGAKPSGQAGNVPGRPGADRIAVAPTMTDYCSEGFTLKSFYRGEAELISFYERMDNVGVTAQGLAHDQTGPPTEWLALSLRKHEGIQKYALARRDRDRHAGKYGEVIIIPLSPEDLKFDQNGKATVYLPTPVKSEQYAFVSYDQNRPGTFVETIMAPFTVGQPDNHAASGNKNAIVCNVLASEVIALSAFGGDGPATSLPNGAPDEGEVNNGRVTTD